MKTTYAKILVLAMAILVALAGSMSLRAAEEQEKDIWAEDEPGQAFQQAELPEKMVERILNQLAETEPERAEGLRKLREEDPEKFRLEIRRARREQLTRRYREQRRRAGEPSPVLPQRPDIGPGGYGGRVTPARPGREIVRERLFERHEEFVEWLRKNYPKDAQRLAELRKEKPELYARQVGLVYRQYRRIFEASKENPQLAKVLKEDLELTKERDKLLRKIRAESNENEREKLVKELKDIVSKRFDLLIKRRQIEYERLSKQLERLKERVKQSEAEVEKWKATKDNQVKERLEELISRTEKFRWD